MITLRWGSAWCRAGRDAASENIRSKRVLEKSGMKLVGAEKDGLAVEDRAYDKLIYEYRKRADYETEEVEL